MRLLPPEQRMFSLSEDRRTVYAGVHDREGYRWWTAVPLSDLPNDLVGRDDLVRLGVDPVDSVAS